MGTFVNSRPVFVLYTAAFLDLCAVSMITIHLPTHLRSLGVSHSLVGTIGSIYGFVQFFSCPFVGGYADHHGKKALLIVSIVLCSVGYLLLGVTSSLWLIIALRIYLGLFKHPLNLIQSSLSDLSQSGTESQVQGYYQSACSLAFIVAPPIGGWLMELPDGYTLIGFAVIFIYIINAGLIYLYMPDLGPISVGHSSQPKNRAHDEIVSEGQLKCNQNEELSPSSDLSSSHRWSLVGLLAMRFLLGICGHLWRSSYTLLYTEVHHLSPSEIGYLISFNALIQASTGITVKFTSRFLSKSHHQVYASCLLYAMTLATIGSVVNHRLLFGVIAPMSFSVMLGKISLVSFTYDIIGREHTGTIVGLSGSIMALARLITPMFAGAFIEYYGVTAPIYLASAISASSFLLAGVIFNCNNRKNKVD